MYSVPKDRPGGVICDPRVRLNGFYSAQHYPEHLRRIGFKDPALGKTLVFLTNNTLLPALTIVALYKSRWQVEIILVGPDGDDLVLHMSAKAVDVALRPTELRWRGALAGVASGDTLAVWVRREPAGYCLVANGRERCRLAFTAGQAWSLLQLYPGLAPAAQMLLACLTMFLLGIPVGLVTARARWGWAGFVVGVAGAVVVPPMVGRSPTPLLQLAALGLGVVVAGRAP